MSESFPCADSGPGHARQGQRAERVLSNLSWIQDLARRLVSDPGLADELAQEACVVALERDPRDAASFRGWVAKVLRNLVRQRYRGEGRRSAREEAAARPEALPSAAHLVEEVSVQREVVENVLALDEPYRSTVLLRYFRGLPPREIAEAQGVGVATVQSRLKRAHAKLRERLDGSFGSRGAWAAFFAPLQVPVVPLPESGATSLGSSSASATSSVPLAPSVSVGAASSFGALLMNAKLVLFGLAAAACAATVWIVRAPEEGEPMPSGERVAVAGARPDEVRTNPARPMQAGTAERPERLALSVPGAASAAEGEPAPSARIHVVEGRVLDGNGGALAGIELVHKETGELLAKSGIGGAFQFETDVEQGLLRAEDAGFVTVREGAWKLGSRFETVVVVAPAITLSGRVVDDFGVATAGAVLSFRLPEDFRNRFDAILDGSRGRSWSWRSDVDGGFVFEGLPGLSGARLQASHDGFLPAVIDAPARDQNGLELMLLRPEAPLVGSLRGRVVDADGRGVAEARVGLGLASTVSDARGDFAFELSRAVTSERLYAIKAGFQLVQLERPEEPRELADGTRTTGWPEFVELRLAQPVLRAEGLVVDHRGRPKAGVKLWAEDPTPFPAIGMMPTTAEGLGAGVAIPAEALQSEAYLPDEDAEHYWNNTQTAADPTPMWHWVETDAQGRFALDGLLDRPYRLIAFDEDTWTRTRFPGIRGGDAGIVLELDEPEPEEVLEGVVVTDSGAVVPNARLSLWTPLTEANARIRGGRTHVQLNRRGARTRTDAEGRFRIAGVRASGVRIEVSGDDVVPSSFVLSEEDDLGEVTLSVPVRCHLEVRTGDPDQGGRIVARDADDQRLDFLVISHNSVQATTDMPLRGGTTGVVSLSSQVRLLELWRGEQLVSTRRVRLVPGERNEVLF